MASSNAAILEALAQNLGWPSHQPYRVARCNNTAPVELLDDVAEEVPVSLVFNGMPHVVMLATPTNLEEFALGFSITEGLIANAGEMLSVKVYYHTNGIEVQCKIPEHRFACLANKQRNLAGRTGCGLCGASTLQQAIREPNTVDCSLLISDSDLQAALSDINHRQTLNQLTGAVHAAAWVVPGQGVVALREDVGRHNALDKLIGCIVGQHYDVAKGFVLVTSRASYEMVQKTTAANIQLLAAISAPTGLAIRMADTAGLTLIGFARPKQYVVYTHAKRITHPTPFTFLQ
jgi:FdhD protein